MTSDAELRRLERATADGDPEAARRLNAERRRRGIRKRGIRKRIEIAGSSHLAGYPLCRQGACGGSDGLPLYPRKHRCGGLVHAAATPVRCPCRGRTHPNDLWTDGECLRTVMVARTKCDLCGAERSRKTSRTRS